jgi:DinB family
MIRKYFALLLLTGITLASKGQFADSLRTQLLKDWKRSKYYTLDYLNAMPPDKYSFQPRDSIRTYAQQMIHLAQGTVSLMEASSGLKIPALINRTNLENIPGALTRDSVTYFVNLSYDYAIEALQYFDMNRCYEYVKRGNFNETRLAWMLKAYEHQAHHRGQTTIYIRILGLKPPPEKLFDK